MRNSIKNVAYRPIVSGTKYLAFSFVLPIMILGTVFALHGVYPFGGRQILIHDFWQQHYPFLSDLWHKLRAGSPGSPSLLGGVSPWSWTAGGGYDYVTLIAYYLASPLNLLIVLVPHAWLREALTLVLLVRIGCAGLFTGVFLRGAFKQKGTALATMDGGVSRSKAEGFCLGAVQEVSFFIQKGYPKNSKHDKIPV